MILAAAFLLAFALGLLLGIWLTRSSAQHVMDAASAVNASSGKYADRAARDAGLKQASERLAIAVEVMASGNERLGKQVEAMDKTLGNLSTALIQCGILQTTTPGRSRGPRTSPVGDEL